MASNVNDGPRQSYGKSKAVKETQMASDVNDLEYWIDGIEALSGSSLDETEITQLKDALEMCKILGLNLQDVALHPSTIAAYEKSLDDQMNEYLKEEGL